MSAFRGLPVKSVRTKPIAILGACLAAAGGGATANAVNEDVKLKTDPWWKWERFPHGHLDYLFCKFTSLKLHHNQKHFPEGCGTDEEAAAAVDAIRALRKDDAALIDKVEWSTEWHRIPTRAYDSTVGSPTPVLYRRGHFKSSVVEGYQLTQKHPQASKASFLVMLPEYTSADTMRKFGGPSRILPGEEGDLAKVWAPKSDVQQKVEKLVRKFSGLSGRVPGRFITGDDGDDPKFFVLLPSFGEDFHDKSFVFAERLVTSHNIAVILLENPGRGYRGPAQREKADCVQTNVAAMLEMGAGVVQDARSLLVYLKKKGFNHLGVGGMSMGGELAPLVAMRTEFPVACVPLLPAHSAGAIFMKGVLRTDVHESTNVGEMDRMLSETDCRSFGTLPAPKACILGVGYFDSYIPQWSSRMLHKHLEGSRIEWLEGGHVSCFLGKQKEMAKLVDKSFRLLSNNYLKPHPWDKKMEEEQAEEQE